MWAVLSVSMVCCCWRESCSCRFCSLELWHTRVALWSFCCREDTWGGKSRGRRWALEALLLQQTRGGYLIVCNTVPYHSSSAAHSHSSSSPPPSVAGKSSALLHMLTETTAVQPPIVPKTSHGQCTLAIMIKIINSNRYFYRVKLRLIVFVQTLLADWAACSFKLCSNSSFCLTSTCFCCNEIKMKTVRLYLT